MLLLVLAALAHAGEPAGRSQVVTVDFAGVISPDMLKRFQAALERVSGDPFPAGLIVHIDSPGGDGLVAMHMGRLAREHKAHMFVRGRCASACVFVLAGGVVRSAPDGALGLHRGMLIEQRPGVGKVAADLSREKVRALLDSAERQAASYFAEMGMPPELFQAMQAVPHADIRRLSRAEAEKLGLVGIDPAYAKERSALARSRFGTDAAAFASRSLGAQQACPEVRPAKTFIDCYRQSLQGAPAR